MLKVAPVVVLHGIGARVARRGQILRVGGDQSVAKVLARLNPQDSRMIRLVS